MYTSPILLPLVAHLLEDFGALDKLEGFVGGFGRAFYGRELSGAQAEKKTVLRKVEGRKVAEEWSLGDETVVPFWAGKELRWEIVADA